MCATVRRSDSAAGSGLQWVVSHRQITKGGEGSQTAIPYRAKRR